MVYLRAMDTNLLLLPLEEGDTRPPVVHRAMLTLSNSNSNNTSNTSFNTNNINSMLHCHHRICSNSNNSNIHQ